MRAMLALLTKQEQNALKLIAFRVQMDPSQLVRLLELDLIEWNGCSWLLTAVGRQLYAGLVAAKA